MTKWKEPFEWRINYLYSSQTEEVGDVCPSVWHASASGAAKFITRQSDPVFVTLVAREGKIVY